MKRSLLTNMDTLTAGIADVNADGKADAADAKMLCDYLLTKINTFPEQYYTVPEKTADMRQMEYLSRGVSAVSNGSGVFVSWRLLVDDGNANNTRYIHYSESRRINRRR